MKFFLNVDGCFWRWWGALVCSGSARAPSKPLILPPGIVRAVWPRENKKVVLNMLISLHIHQRTVVGRKWHYGKRIASIDSTLPSLLQLYHLVRCSFWKLHRLTTARCPIACCYNKISTYLNRVVTQKVENANENNLKIVKCLCLLCCACSLTLLFLSPVCHRHGDSSNPVDVWTEIIHKTFFLNNRL